MEAGMKMRQKALLGATSATALYLGTIPLIAPGASGVALPLAAGWLALPALALASRAKTRAIGLALTTFVGLFLVGSGYVVAAAALPVLFALMDRTRRERISPIPPVILGLLVGSVLPAIEYYQSFLKGLLQDFDVVAIGWGSLAVALVILGTLAMLTGRFQRKTRGCGPVAAALRVPMPTAGVLPFVIAVPVLDWTATAMLAPPPSPFDASISAALITSMSGWGLARLLVLYAAAFALSSIFNPRDEMERAWRKSLGADSSDLAKGLVTRNLRHAARMSRWYLLALLFVHEFGGELAYSLGIVAIVVGTAVAFDLRSELDFREAVGFYVTIYEPNDAWEVAHVRAALEAENIPVFVRGLGLRSVLRKAAFWGDLEVMVPGKNLEDAERIIHELGLAPPYDRREDVVEEHDDESHDGE